VTRHSCSTPTLMPMRRVITWRSAPPLRGGSLRRLA
jgi:hypothetical protein